MIETEKQIVFSAEQKDQRQLGQQYQCASNDVQIQRHGRSLKMSRLPAEGASESHFQDLIQIEANHLSMREAQASEKLMFISLDMNLP